MNPFHLPRARLEEMAAKYGTPIYLVSREQIKANCRRLDACLPSRSSMR